MMRWLLLLLVRLLPAPRVIKDREGGAPYLSRWYLIAAKPDEDLVLKGQALPRDGWLSRLPINLYLHRFHRSDDDSTLHSHPWRWSVALVLVGGYSEERRVGDKVMRREVKPPAINFLRGDDYHRVDLLEHDAWSLFLSGPKVSTWYFWDRVTLKRSMWRDWISFRRGEAGDAKWEADARGGT